MTTTKDKRPSRRQMLAYGAAAATIGACSGENADADQASAAPIKKRTLRMVTTWPKSLPGLGTGAQRLAERITTLSNGSLDVRVYAAGDLVGAFDAFDAVSSGKADMYHGGEYYWQGKSKAYNFYAGVPFGMTADEMAAWINFQGGQELWDELSAQFNIKPFAAGNTGTQMGGWFKREINSLEDLKGLRIRMPGLGGEILRRLGAEPVTKAANELYLALSQGNIDATEWIGPWNDLTLGLHTAAKYYYGPGFHEPGSTLALGVNLDVFNSLSDHQRAVITQSCQVERHVMHAEYDAKNAEALEVLKTEHDIVPRTFPADVMAAAQREAAIVLEEVAQSDALTGRVVASFKAALKKARSWEAVAHGAFTQARNDALG
ncbi:MAG: TRAP transporter substrate-binding protein [Pseudomonadota bacterium]